MRIARILSTLAGKKHLLKIDWSTFVKGIIKHKDRFKRVKTNSHLSSSRREQEKMSEDERVVTRAALFCNFCSLHFVLS